MIYAVEMASDSMKYMTGFMTIDSSNITDSGIQNLLGWNTQTAR
jgi:hypothetical protein